jgi:hypothetical protein
MLKNMLFVIYIFLIIIVLLSATAENTEYTEKTEYIPAAAVTEGDDAADDSPPETPPVNSVDTPLASEGGKEECGEDCSCPPCQRGGDADAASGGIDIPEITDIPEIIEEPPAYIWAYEHYMPENLVPVYRTIARYGGGVSVFYKDLINGEEFFYNPDRNYFIASLIKAPYAVYVYRQLMAGIGGNLDDIYVYGASDFREGTGIIKNMAIGTELTLAQLIEYSIRHSDNVAMDKLRRIFPVDGFREYAAEIGLPHLADIRSSAVNGVICALCAAAYIKDIHDFIEEGNIYSEAFREHMLNTRNPMILSRYPIARKYGWAADSFHDFGIVYNDRRPYLLAILSDDNYTEGYGEFSMFREISVAVQTYNDGKIITPQP